MDMDLYYRHDVRNDIATEIYELAPVTLTAKFQLTLKLDICIEMRLFCFYEIKSHFLIFRRVYTKYAIKLFIRKDFIRKRKYIISVEKPCIPLIITESLKYFENRFLINICVKLQNNTYLVCIECLGIHVVGRILICKIK